MAKWFTHLNSYEVFLSPTIPTEHFKQQKTSRFEGYFFAQKKAPEVLRLLRAAGHSLISNKPNYTITYQSLS